MYWQFSFRFTSTCIDELLMRSFCFYVCGWQEVYDWAGAMTDMPLHFTIQRRSQVVKHEVSLEGQEVLDIYERVRSHMQSSWTMNKLNK